MFRNITHSYKIIRDPFVNGAQIQGFSSIVNVYKPRRLHRTMLYIYTPHLLTCWKFNYDLDAERKMNSYKYSNIPPKVLCQQPYNPHIYFPYDTCFATYEYAFPISLERENTFVLLGGTKLDKINMVFVANDDPDQYYEFTIKEYLLESGKKQTR
jgi:hypothetical protein